MALDIVAVERTIPADAATIFDVLADPKQHAAIDGSGSVRQANSGPVRLSKGAEFGMAMKVGAPYKVTNTVVEFDEGRLIAWRHFAGHRWRYTLTPVVGGTLVREEWDPTRVSGPQQFLYRLMRFPQTNRKGMEATLVRLEQHVPSDSA